MMNKEEIVKFLDFVCGEEKYHGPLGGMAWDDIAWNAQTLVDQYHWTNEQLIEKWPELFKNN